ncbi:hypothetical protein [Aurantiacibacter zhengii]|nr:hypothetical protein [Aurantiacibacter zhengii]
MALRKSFFGMRHSTSSALMLSVLTIPLPSAAQEEALSPSSPWNLDMADENCALSRTFGEGTDWVLLEFRSYAPSDLIVTTIVSAMDVRERVDGRLSFGSNFRDSRTTEFEHFELEDGLNAVRLSFYPNFPRSSEAWLAIVDEERDVAEAAADHLSVERIFSDNIRLATGSMHEPFNAMRSCLTDLIDRWGLDVEAHQDLSRVADWPRRGSWIGSAIRRMPNNIERIAFRKAHHMVMTVEPDGSVSQCRPMVSVEQADFAREFCPLAIADGNFLPAQNSDGDEIQSIYLFSIRADRSVTQLTK